MIELNDGLKIFSQLRRSSAYRPGKDRIKQQILISFWNEAGPRLQEQFSPDGRKDDAYGFGYLVEEFAKLSPLIPRNTSKAEHLAQLILTALRSGEQSLINVKRMYNPDLLWVKFIGRRAEITGIGEIKASAVAYQKKPEQAILQESSVLKTLKRIEKDKNDGVSHRYFQERKIIAKKSLKKIMIAPAGQKVDFLKILPVDWECMEIEYSYDELTFIAQKLWPEYRPEIKFEDGLLRQYEKSFLHPFLQWGIERIKYIFQEEDTASFLLPVKELLFFVCAVKKLLLSEKAISLIIPLVREYAGLFYSYPTMRIDEENFNQWEKSFVKKFTLLFGIEAKKWMPYFFANLRQFKKKITKRLKKIEKSIAEEMDDCNILHL